MFMYCVDINKYTNLLPGYSLLLRPGEVGHRSARTLTQKGCTDLAGHDVPSWHIERTGR